MEFRNAKLMEELLDVLHVVKQVLLLVLLVLAVIIAWRTLGVLDQVSDFLTDSESAWTAPWLNIINRGPVQ